MGSMQLAGMIEMGGTGDDILTWHLTSPSQCYPPHPMEMVATARMAIDAANEDDFDRLIDLPDGCEYRDGRTAIEAWILIDSLHLEAFVEQEEYWED